MEHSLYKYWIAGLLFTAVSGTLLHFFWEWMNYSKLIGFIAPVNESIWEHLKLLFFPALLYFMATASLWTEYDSVFYNAVFLSLLTGMIFIPIFFCSYTVFSGSPILFLDILSFFLAIFLTFCLFRILLTFEPLSKVPAWYGVFGLILLCLMFFLFSYYPPDCFLFRDWSGAGS